MKQDEFIITYPKIYPPLPVVGNTAVQGGMPNSVCGLSFGKFASRPVTNQMKKMDVW